MLHKQVPGAAGPQGLPVIHLGLAKFVPGTTGPPPTFTGFPHGGQYLLVSLTRPYTRFGWAWGTN